MVSRRGIFLALVSCLAATALAATANVAGAADVTEARRDVRQDLDGVEQSIQTGQARRQALAQQVRAAADQTELLRRRAILAARQAQREEAALSVIDTRLTRLQQQDKAHRRRLKYMRHGMTRSISALARLERQPAAAMLVAPGTMLDAARGGRLLAAVLPALHRDAHQVGEILAAAGQTRQDLQREQKQRTVTAAALSARRVELQDLLAARAVSDQRLQTAGDQEGKRLAMLAVKARDLRSLIRRLDLAEQQARTRAEQRAADPVVALDAADKRSDVRSDMRRRKFAAGMARALATPPKQRSAKPEAEAKSQQLALAPGRAHGFAQGQTDGQTDGQTQGGAPFAKLRGRPRLPATGKRVGSYGESTGFGPRAQGITLRTRRQAQVIAPYDGNVVFAGPFRDYGLILIISHGGGYHTLLAGLSRLQAVVGQHLLTGEPVGVMGGAENRSLYIELRRKGTAINPNSWWSRSRERASG